jgi:hypothetical protein
MISDTHFNQNALTLAAHRNIILVIDFKYINLYCLLTRLAFQASYRTTIINNQCNSSPFCLYNLFY